MAKMTPEEIKAKYPNLEPMTPEKRAKAHANANSPEAVAKRKETWKRKKIIKEEILKKMKQSDWDEVIENMIDRAKKTDQGFKTFEASIGQSPTQTAEVELKSGITITITGDDDDKS